jgi:beta-lactamase class A
MRILSALLVLISVMIGQPSKNISDLNSRIDSLIADHPGEYAVACIDLNSSFKYFRNEHTSFHAASTMKTPVMLEVYRQAAQGMLSLDDSLPIQNSFRSIIDGTEYSLDLSDDSDDDLYVLIGQKRTIRQLLFKMITVSSNLATNILIERVGPENVMRTMEGMGLKEIKVLRGVEDGKAFKAGKNNTTTAYDLARIFESIARGTAVSKEASIDMLSVLKAQRFKDMIPAKLPDNVIVAHKTGSITNVQHDSGIIMLPDGRAYVLVILSSKLRSNADGIACIAELSRVIYDHYTK